MNKQGKKLTQKDAEFKSFKVGIKLVGIYQGSHIKTEFECPFCKSIFISTLNHVTRKDKKSCGCINWRWQGTKNVSGSYFQCLQRSAKRRRYEFDITVDYIQSLLEKQQYRCILTGLPIECTRTQNKSKSTYKEQTASLDRVDSSKGYIEGNVQWVHKDVNFMKKNLPEKRLIELCKLIVKKSKNS